MGRYTTKLQNIQEANVRLEKRLLNEQQEFTDTPLPGCLNTLFKITSQKSYPNCEAMVKTIEKGGTISTQMKANCAKDLGLQANDPKIDELVNCITNANSDSSDDEKG